MSGAETWSPKLDFSRCVVARASSFGLLHHALSRPVNLSVRFRFAALQHQRPLWTDNASHVVTEDCPSTVTRRNVHPLFACVVAGRKKMRPRRRPLVPEPLQTRKLSLAEAVQSFLVLLLALLPCTGPRRSVAANGLFPVPAADWIRPRSGKDSRR